MATQITATLPTLDFPREVDYPTQEDWAAFSAAAEENFGILGGDWSAQMQLWKAQANAMSIELNNSADIAQSTVNYKGDWISQGYALNESVSVDGIYYICKLTHATGQNPTAVGSLYWNLAIGNWNLKADKTEVASKLDKDFSAFADKTTPIDADVFPVMETSGLIKKLSWSNIKATLKAYFDTLYATPTYVDGKMVLGTAVNSISGTAIDFTGIPSWVKRITVMFNGVSTNGTSARIIQLGAGTVETTGYISAASGGQSGVTSLTSSIGLIMESSISASDTLSVVANIVKISGNSWVFNSDGQVGIGAFRLGGGSKTLSGVLDRIRITTSNGTDTFDAGSINIMYEG